jgi:putative spermidine/putrescine transport system ATP-binding protein
MTVSVPLRLEGISKTFGTVQALKPLNLSVGAGEMLALLGPSGCGKTTTLRIIAGFETPSTGSVFIGDRDVTEIAPNKRALGMVFQSYGLFPHMSVADNVAYGLKVRGVPAADRVKRVRAMLELVRLGQYEDRAIHQLSGGQQQRVALARSLVTDPTILLLDEPLGALDKNLRERMQFELREIQRRLGITSILVTHDQEEALTMSNRIAVMAEGQIVQIGTPTEIYERPRTQFVSEFLGTANIFDGVVATGTGDGEWLVRLDGGGTGKVRDTSDASLKVGQQVTFAVRPERLELVANVADALPVTIRDVVFRGSYYAYELALGERDDPIFVYSQSKTHLPDDGQIGVSWPIDSAIVLPDAARS